MRRFCSWIVPLLPALAAMPAFAADWGNVAVISSTMGVNAGRICVGEGLRVSDIGCPAYAPYIDPATGNIGIGTTAPSVTLHINSTRDAGLGDTTGAMVIGPTNDVNVVFDSNELQARRHGVASGYYINAGGGNIFLGGAAGSNVGVGLGTAAISQTLHVSGTARITSWTTVAANLSPTAALDVYGTVSATNFVGDGSGLTGIAANGDRLTSGTAFVQAVRDRGGEVSGTLTLTSTGDEVCDAAHHYALRVNPSTGFVQMCRP
jgi:hypothetical protein